MEHISDNKLKHMRSVAELMYENSKKLGFSEEEAMNMYVLGFVHDIGYAIEADGHSKHGYKMLKSSGLHHSYEVYHHGNPDPPVVTTKLMLLQYCDMSVMPDGAIVDFETRLEDIKDRYGEKSKQYINSCKICGDLKNSEMFDRLK